MDDRAKTAFEFARDTTKQLITIATGIITLEITFSKDFVGKVNNDIRIYALISWFLFLLSVVSGLWTLMALTGTLEPKTPTEIPETKENTTPISIRGKHVTIPASLQVILFGFGLIFTFVFGVLAGCIQ